MTGISKSQVSRLYAGIDGKVATFLDRPLEGDWPFVWLDATYVKVRQDGRIVSVAVIIAVGANTAGRREVLGMDIGPSDRNLLDRLPAQAGPLRLLSMRLAVFRRGQGVSGCSDTKGHSQTTAPATALLAEAEERGRT